MSCTGMIHGSTLSYSRMIVMPEVTRWRDIKSPTWNDVDLNVMTTALPTMQGMTEDRHVSLEKSRMAESGIPSLFLKEYKMS